MIRKYRSATRGMILAIAGAVPLATSTSASAAPNITIPPKSACTWKDDFLGGFHRLHGRCPGRQVMVSVRCTKSGQRTSAYPRPEYNKAECRLKRDGDFFEGAVFGIGSSKLPPNKPHRPR